MPFFFQPRNQHNPFYPPGSPAADRLCDRLKSDHGIMIVQHAAILTAHCGDMVHNGQNGSFFQQGKDGRLQLVIPMDLKPVTDISDPNRRLELASIVALEEAVKSAGLDITSDTQAETQKLIKHLEKQLEMLTNPVIDLSKANTTPPRGRPLMRSTSMTNLAPRRSASRDQKKQTPPSLKDPKPVLAGLPGKGQTLQVDQLSSSNSEFNNGLLKDYIKMLDDLERYICRKTDDDEGEILHEKCGIEIQRVFRHMWGIPVSKEFAGMRNQLLRAFTSHIDQLMSSFDDKKTDHKWIPRGAFWGKYSETYHFFSEEGHDVYLPAERHNEPFTIRNIQLPKDPKLHDIAKQLIKLGEEHQHKLLSTDLSDGNNLQVLLRGYHQFLKELADLVKTVSTTPGYPLIAGYKELAISLCHSVMRGATRRYPSYTFGRNGTYTIGTKHYKANGNEIVKPGTVAAIANLIVTPAPAPTPQPQRSQLLPGASNTPTLTPTPTPTCVKCFAPATPGVPCTSAMCADPK